MKFLRRVNKADYIENQTVSIDTSTGATEEDTIENLPKNPDEALEVEIEGRRYILLAYTKKN